MKKLSNQSGHAILLSTIVMSLAMVGFSLAMLQGSYRSQNMTRTAAIVNELATKDLALRRNIADDLMRQTVSAINSGGGSSSISNAPRDQYFSGSPVVAPGISLNISDTNAASIATVSGGPIISLSNSTAAWSPTTSLYSSVALPSGVFRVKSGTVLGRQWSGSYQRQITIANNLNGGGTTSQATTNTARLRVIEFPSQTAVWGKTVRVRNVATVNGSVIAQSAQLDAGATVTGSVTVSRSLNAVSGARVKNTTLSRDFVGSSSAALAKSLEIGDTPIDSDTISMIRGNDSASLVELGDRTLDTEGIPQILLPASSATNWDAYTRPYYQCGTRIVVQIQAGGFASYAIYKNSTDTIANRLATSGAIRSGNLTIGAAMVNSLRVYGRGSYTVLAVDVGSLATLVGNTYARAVHVDFKDAAGTHLGSPICVTLTNATNLSALQGFSLVTPNRLVLTGNINTTTPVPSSLFSYSTHYGWDAAASSVTVTGQIGNLGAVDNANNDVFGMRSLGGRSVPDARKTISISDTVATTALPPITLLNWLVLTYEN